LIIFYRIINVKTSAKTRSSYVPATITRGISDDPSAGKGLLLRSALARMLRGHGYLVLEAHDVPKAFELVRMHSRPIHLLIMGMSFDETLAPTLKPYRPNMHALRVAADQTQPIGAGVLTLESAPEMIRQFFNMRKSDDS
jgi:hypothetical protein